MVSFSTITTGVTALLAAQAVALPTYTIAHGYNHLDQAVLSENSDADKPATPESVVKTLQGLTVKTRAYQGYAITINPSVVPLVVVGRGPVADVIKSNLEITEIAAELAWTFNNADNITKKDDAAAVAQAWNEFATSAALYFGIIASKTDFFSHLPFASQPLVSSLRAIEGMTDSLTYGFSALVPGQVNEIQTSSAALDAALDRAIGGLAAI